MVGKATVAEGEKFLTIFSLSIETIHVPLPGPNLHREITALPAHVRFSNDTAAAVQPDAIHRIVTKAAHEKAGCLSHPDFEELVEIIASQRDAAIGCRRLFIFVGWKGDAGLSFLLAIEKVDFDLCDAFHLREEIMRFAVHPPLRDVAPSVTHVKIDPGESQGTQPPPPSKKSSRRTRLLARDRRRTVFGIG